MEPFVLPNQLFWLNCRLAQGKLDWGHACIFQWVRHMAEVVFWSK